ncbi:TrmB family transcriptional regulator [Haloterrigena salifodinae]|uniref:TrmB family transcriptional regulator n=1 Tax=Haloterrigena salifodinae TaxID=2675099 RepID=UPI000F865A9C|nr:helix-turn-helix domain-containing protein [Haloterrigena salifodinae]
MSALRELGVSSYEESAYRTLLVTGPSTAADVATASDVPRGRIYDVLNGLSARRLVRTRSADPKRYVAVEPETAVDRLLAERRDELVTKWTRSLEVADRLRSDLVPQPSRDGHFWPGSLGSDGMLTALRHHARATDERVRMIAGIPYEYARADALRSETDVFFEELAGDIDVDLVCSAGVLEKLADSIPSAAADHAADVRVRGVPDLPLSFDIVDGTTATIEIPHPRTNTDRFGVIGLTDSRIVNRLERQFQQLWDEATPVL